MSTAVLSWTLRCALRSPLAWLIWAVSTASIPALELLSPIGLTTSERGGVGLLGEVLTAAALAGAVFGLEGLSKARGLFSRQRANSRAIAGLTLAGSTVIFMLPAFLVALVFTPTGLSVSYSAELWPVLPVVAHVAALAWLLALLPIPHGLRSILLVFLAWLLAGWISTTSLPIAALSTLVDVSHASRIDLRAASWSARIVAAAPIMVLVGACFLVRPTRATSS